MKKFLSILVFATVIAMGSSTAQNYDNAIGIRGGWGFGASFKHFLNESAALEGVLRYRSFGTLGFNYSYVQVTGLYQIHNPLDDVLTGLQWYYGGGAFVGFWGGSYAGLIDGDRTYIGVAGNIGLDYAFEDIPLNISVDWIPSIAIVGGGGFLGGGGGVGIRYIF